MIEQPTGGDWPEIGEVIDELVHKAVIEKAVIWEDHLRLHIKPKPAWCPDRLWAKLLNLVLIQSTQRR